LVILGQNKWDYIISHIVCPSGQHTQGAGPNILLFDIWTKMWKIFWICCSCWLTPHKNEFIYGLFYLAPLTLHRHS
jgi:hypothetical protein